MIVLTNGVVIQDQRDPEVLLEFSLPELPPSDNELYFTRPGRHGTKKILSDTGKNFKNGIKEYLTTIHQESGMPFITKAMMLHIYVLCSMPHLFTTTKAAQNWFRIVDAHNRGKVLIDAIAEHFGLQDAQSFKTHLEKCEGPPAVYVRLKRIEAQPTWPAGFPRLEKKEGAM